MELFCIDTGTTQSAYCHFDTNRLDIIDIGILQNRDMSYVLKKLRSESYQGKLVLEMFKSYGMAMGDSVLVSCVWIGRFIESFNSPSYDLIPRKTIVTKLCGKSTANDSNVRLALKEHYANMPHHRAGEFYKAGQDAKAITRKSGSLYDIKKDMWAALAIATTYDTITGELLA